MKPAIYHMSVIAGSKDELIRAWRRAVNGVPGDPIDLAGYTGRFVVYRPDGQKLIDRNTENGGMVLTPSTGGIRVILTAESTRIPLGEYSHLLVLSKDLRDYPLLTGRYSATPGAIT